MYERTGHTASCAAKKQGNRASASTKQREDDRIRMLQLVVCAVLFLLVSIGNGLCPEKMEGVVCQIRTLTTQDVDLREAFSKLGDTISGEDPTLQKLQDFCVQVFVPERVEDEIVLTSFEISRPEPALTEEIKSLAATTTGVNLSDHYLYPTFLEDDLPVLERTISLQATPAEAVIPEPSVPAVGTVLLDVEYSGKALPANYTMNQLSLGDLETVTPVLGHLNSEYGYRDHPVNGKYLFHGGVDIGGQNGDPILAFSSGTVAYVGENKSYGLYLQLDHGNGVKSFYAHCKRICVKKGQTVSVGEKIAEVGSTGTATGPHLHLELKYNDIHVNPEYYLDFLNT